MSVAFAAPGPDAPTPPHGDVLTIDPTLRRKIETARDYIAEHSWPEAVRLLQAVLDSPADSFIPMRKKPDGRPSGWVGARAQAERLLASLPPAGRDHYQLRYDEQARRLRGSLRSVREAARLYRCTPAGAAALERLAGHLLDRGDVDLAAACFRRLLQPAELSPPGPTGLLQAALAFHGSGDRTAEEAAWDALSRRLGDQPYRLRTRSLKLSDLRREATELPLRPGANEDWLLFRGDRRRSAAGEGVTFLLQPTRRIPTAAPEAYQLLQRATRNATPGALPAAVPLAVGGRIVYRSAAGIHALDADSGRELWRASSPLALESILRDHGKKVQLLHWFGLYGNAGSLLYENSTLGTLSADGQHVYAVDDLPLPPHPDLIAARNSGAVRSFGPLKGYVDQNRLRAIDLASGAIAWEAGGVPPAPPPKPGGKPMRPRLEAADLPPGAWFLGPPLPLAGELFVLLDKDGEIVLACLDAARGDVLWTQPLVAGKSLLEEVPRRVSGLQLACAEGVLVCPTCRGALIGIDPLSRHLLWAYIYRDFGQVDPAADPSTLLSVQGWSGTLQACSPIIADGRVVFTSAEHDAIECLRLRDGTPLWKAGREEGDLYVAGILAGKVLIVGRSRCRAVDLADGRTVWEWPTPLPAGQGIASGGTYYLPLQDGGVHAINVLQPRASYRLERPAGSHGVQGNLIFHRGMLWSQGLDHIAAYPSQEYRLAHVEERLARTPADPRLLAERGRLHLDRGDTARAVADLHAATSGDPPTPDAAACRRELFRALSLLLRQDFPAAQKYLDDYRSLCSALPPCDPPARRRRLLELDALIASGRQRQGRLDEDLRACRNVLDRALADDLLIAPEDPTLDVRPDAWVREHLASLARTGTRAIRRALAQERDRAWRAVENEPMPALDLSAAGRYAALFDAVPDVDGASAMHRAQLGLARRLLHSPYQGNGLSADLLLGMLVESQGDPSPEFPAEALRLRAELLTRHGRIADAAECYRRLGRDLAGVAVAGGLTGGRLLAEARLDRRFFFNLAPPDKPRWQGVPLRPVERPGGPRADAARLFCDLRQPLPPAVPGTLGPGTLPSAWRDLRFVLDGRALCLLALDQHSGQERFRLPLPFPRFPDYLRGVELSIGGIDHLLLVPAGQYLIAIDLLDRRIRWTRNVLDGDLARAQVTTVLPDARVQITMPDSTVRTVGLVGPVCRNAVFVVTGAGLLCLEPASGAVRWRRRDAPATLELFGDEETIYTVEAGSGDAIGSVRAYRVSDGAALAIPRAAAIYGKRVQILGSRLLARDDLPGGRLRLHLYDTRTGKDIWSQEFPAGSSLLDATRTPWCAVAVPDGKITLLSLETGMPTVRLAVDPRHMEKSTGTVLADINQVYIAWAAEQTPDAAALETAQCRSGMPVVKLNGSLYTFDRTTGAVRWTSATPAQYLLLEEFEELPILLCAMRLQKLSAGQVIQIKALRSIDKRTGKLLYNREFVPEVELFQELRTDPEAGTIDLIGPTMLLRHQPAER
jgi:outer membrane protein assembly factor BamB/tetratricopeptide (TPR) repeat protein